MNVTRKYVQLLHLCEDKRAGAKEGRHNICLCGTARRREKTTTLNQPTGASHLILAQLDPRRQDEEFFLMRLNALSCSKNCFTTVKLRTADR